MKDKLSKWFYLYCGALYLISAMFAACSLLNLPTGQLYQVGKTIVGWSESYSNFFTVPYVVAAVFYDFSINLEWLKLAYSWMALNLLLMALFLIVFSFRQGFILKRENILLSFRRMGWKGPAVFFLLVFIASSADAHYDPEMLMSRLMGDGVIFYSLFVIQLSSIALLLLLQNLIALLVHKVREPNDRELENAGKD